MMMIENVEKNKIVSLYNVVGLLVGQIISEGPTLQVDLSAYNSGVYFVKVNGMNVQKFVKF
jgi:hypothetical protein